MLGCLPSLLSSTENCENSGRTEERGSPLRNLCEGKARDTKCRV